MFVEQMGYRVSGLPSDGTITIEPDPALQPQVRVSVDLLRGSDSIIVYDLPEAMVLRDALEHAIRLANQMIATDKN
jgi:hypothetical protein